jgi:hypothetical protein
MAVGSRAEQLRQVTNDLVWDFLPHGGNELERRALAMQRNHRRDAG